jgi:transposase
MPRTAPDVIVGIDTHKRTHTVALTDKAGNHIAARQFAADRKGYAAAYKWMCSFGTITKAGIEGTGSYGAGICLYLRSKEIAVLDVMSPDREERSRIGKDDTIDAYQAADAARGNKRCAPAKDRQGLTGALQQLTSAHELLMRQHTACMNALRSHIISVDGALRERLEAMDADALIDTCAAFRCSEASLQTADGATRFALRSLACHAKALHEGTRALEEAMAPIIAALAPRLLALYGCGVQCASTLYLAVGADITRIKSERAFAMLCGAAPLPVASGDTHHHRLSRRGNRKANSALYTIALVRMGHDERTREFIRRQMSKGKTKKDAMRCLKRYIARIVYGALRHDLLDLEGAEAGCVAV